MLSVHFVTIFLSDLEFFLRISTPEEIFGGHINAVKADLIKSGCHSSAREKVKVLLDSL